MSDPLDSISKEDSNGLILLSLESKVRIELKYKVDR